MGLLGPVGRGPPRAGREMLPSGPAGHGAPVQPEPRSCPVRVPTTGRGAAALAALLSLTPIATCGDPPPVPKAWDDDALATWHLPLAAPGAAVAPMPAA